MTMFLMFCGYGTYWHPTAAAFAPRAFGFFVFLALLLLGIQAFVVLPQAIHHG